MMINRDFWRNKNVLITGHTGFKGSWLTQILLELGADVAGYSLVPPTTPSLFHLLDLEPQMNHKVGDIRDQAKLRSFFASVQPEIVFHLAAQPLVRDSYDDPVYTYETNIMGTVYVLESMRELQIPTGVIITTDKVYSNQEQPDYFYNEQDPLGSHDPYSTSKAGAELVTQSYIESFFPVSRYRQTHETLIASARAGNVIGGGDWAKDRLMTDIVQTLLKGETLELRNPHAVRPWQHVLEPLAGYLMLAEKLHNHDTAKVGAWNFGPLDKAAVTVEQIVHWGIEMLGQGAYVVNPANDHKKEAQLLQLDATKAKEQLGWELQFSAEQTVEKTLAWYQQFYQNRNQVKEITMRQIGSYFGI